MRFNTSLREYKCYKCSNVFYDTMYQTYCPSCQGRTISDMMRALSKLEDKKCQTCKTKEDVSAVGGIYLCKKHSMSYSEARDKYAQDGGIENLEVMLEKVTLTHPKMRDPAEDVNKVIEYNNLRVKAIESQASARTDIRIDLVMMIAFTTVMFALFPIFGINVLALVLTPAFFGIKLAADKSNLKKIKIPEKKELK